MVAGMAVGAQIDTSEREAGNTKISLLNGDQKHEDTRTTGTTTTTTTITGQ